MKAEFRTRQAEHTRALCGILALWLLAVGVEAQESLRMSLAGAAAAAAQRESATTPGYYNLKVGPTMWSFNAGLALEGSDNIRLTYEDPKADLLFRPQINTRMLWPISDKNSLNLAVGAGYSAYAQYSEYNRLYLSPGSQLSFDIFAGDFRINLHDRFSITEDTYQDPTVVGSGDYSQLQNTLGVNTTWDLNKVLVKAGFDHVNYVQMQGGSGTSSTRPDGASEVFSLSAGHTLKRGLEVGLVTGSSLIHYSSSSSSQLFQDATEWNVGVFSEAQVSEHLRFRATVGYTEFIPDLLTNDASGGDFSGFYGQLALTHNLNELVSYALRGGRSVSVAFSGGALDMSSVQLAIDWKIFRKLTFQTSFQYEHGAYLTSGSETFDRFGPSFSLSRPITKKLSGSLTYRYFNRTSNVQGYNYGANIAALTLTYKF